MFEFNYFMYTRLFLVSTELLNVGNRSNLSTLHVYILGNEDGLLHSTAIAIGPTLVLTCAHVLPIDYSPEVPVYCENYIVQKSRSSTERVALKLYKFNLVNDWALLKRSDDAVFEEYAEIDTNIPVKRFIRGNILHYPVAILSKYTPAECDMLVRMADITVQEWSNHHVLYSYDGGLGRGSSGGALHIGNKVLAMHSEQTDDSVVHDADEEEAAATSSAYAPSESACSGTRVEYGERKALIICRCERLMYYINKVNDEHLLRTEGCAPDYKRHCTTTILPV